MSLRTAYATQQQLFNFFFFIFWFFETRFLCVALGVLEQALQTRLASNSQRSASTCLCLQRARVKGVHYDHQHPIFFFFFFFFFFVPCLFSVSLSMKRGRVQVTVPKMSQESTSWWRRIILMGLRKGDSPGVLVHTFNPSTREAEAGGFLSSRPAGLQSEFQDSQGYRETMSRKTNKQKIKKKERKGDSL